MEEELEKESVSNTSIAIESQTEQASEVKLDSLPRLEDLLKSEKEIQKKTELQGLTKVEKSSMIENKTFARKSDQKRAFIKKRIKLVTIVYSCVLALMVAFAGVNLFTMLSTQKDITKSKDIVKTQTQQIAELEQAFPGADMATDTGMVTLNEPRDYNDDKKELTFLDKITILFRSIFS